MPLTELYVPENIAQTTHPRHRQYGYLFVRSPEAYDVSPNYWGEVEFRNGPAYASLRYMINEFDQEEGQYEISLFGDRGFKTSVIDATICFVDHAANLITAEIISAAREWDADAEDVLKVMHIVAYECLVERLSFQPRINDMLKDGFVFPFDTPDIHRDIRDQVGLTLERMIPAVNTRLFA